MMKNVLQLAVALVLSMTVFSTYAQDVAFGLKGGVNLSNINSKDAQATYDSRTGYHAGLFLRGKFGKAAIQPELLLFTQSTKVTTSLYSAEDNFTYLSIPVMVKFYPVAGLNIQAGPQFGYLLDGQRKETLFQSATTTKDIKDYYKNSDVSVSVGAGYDFDFGLGIDFRYNIGVQDINDAAGGSKAKSQVYLVSIGWNFLK